MTDNPSRPAAFISLWRSSSIIQGLLALICICAIVFLAVTARPIPEVLTGTLFAIIGFYFGTKKVT